MPAGNGTGPVGMGPMTGRGAGFCAGYSMPGYANPTYGRGRSHFGFGRGRGFFGRGRGQGFGRAWGYAPYDYPTSAKDEASMLKEQAKFMQSEIDAMNSHIKELESTQASKDGE